MKSYTVELTHDEFQFIRILIETQRFNPDPVFVGLRKKFSVEDQNMITESGQSKCKRCGRWFQPTKEGQEYGEKCMRKMSGQTMLQDRYVVPPRKRRHKKASADVIECRDEKGEITAVII